MFLWRHLGLGPDSFSSHSEAKIKDVATCPIFLYSSCVLRPVKPFPWQMVFKGNVRKLQPRFLQTEEGRAVAGVIGCLKEEGEVATVRWRTCCRYTKSRENDHLHEDITIVQKISSWCQLNEKRSALNSVFHDPHASAMRDVTEGTIS